MIGSMLSKLLNLVMLPYISSQLTKDQYGIFDMIQTITSVALPIFTMQSIEAAFRFVYVAKSNEEKGVILGHVWVIILVGSTLFVILLSAANTLWLKLGYVYILAIYYVFNVLINMYQRVARCYDDNKGYAISGVIQTLVMLLFQYVFLRFFKMKEEGLVYAYALSTLASCAYIEWRVCSLKQIHIKSIDRGLVKSIARFSLPLIPNSISWWAVSSVNRVIIVSVLGYAANGVYSMSNKFASIVTMIASTFQLAWQEYGLTEKDNPNRKELFSAVFDHFLVILTCITAGGILVQQLFFDLLIDPEFTESFRYIPLIMISVAFSSMSSFYGAGYFIYKKTSGAFKTTVISAGINLILCFTLVRLLGLYGIAIAGAFAYFILWIMRCVTMKSYFDIRVNVWSVGLFVVGVAAATGIYYMKSNMCSLVAIVLICVLFFIRYWPYVVRFLKNKESSRE